ncbi:MAG: response regulator [Pirellulaceae bacterium]
MIAEADPQLEFSDQGAKRGPVIICDDQPDLRETLALCLKHRGYEPLETGLGQECFRLATETAPRAILLDLCLPDVCGLEVCAELSDSLKTRDIPVIIISGVGEADTVRNVRRAGASFYLHKPYDPNTLLAILQRAIEENESW